MRRARLRSPACSDGRNRSRTSTGSSGVGARRQDALLRSTLTGVRSEQPWPKCVRQDALFGPGLIDFDSAGSRVASGNRRSLLATRRGWRDTRLGPEGPHSAVSPACSNSAAHSPRSRRSRSTQPVRRERRRDPVGLVGQQPARDRRLRRPPTGHGAASPLEQQRRRAGSRPRPARPAARSSPQVEPPHVERDPVDRARSRRGASTAAGSKSSARPASTTRAAPRRSPAPPTRSRGRRTDRPRAARASAPGTAAWSRERRCRTPGRGRSRRRAACRRAAPTAAARVSRAVRAPAAGGTSATARPSRRRSRCSRPPPAPRRQPPAGRAAVGQLPRRSVDRVLDDVVADRRPPRPRSARARAARRARARPDRGGPGRRAGSGQPPNARRSFPNTPSSVRRLSSVSELGQLLEQLALLALQPPRDHDVDDDAQVAGAATAQRRHPLAAESAASRAAACPAGISSSTEPSTVGTSTVVPSAASGAATSTAVTRSSPSRTKRGSSRTRICTYRSPGGPPRSPTWPRPATRIRWPSAIPAGHVDRDLRRARRAARGPPQSWHGSFGDPPVAVAHVARRGAHDLAERRPRDSAQLAGAAAARARLDRGPGLGAVAVDSARTAR